MTRSKLLGFKTEWLVGKTFQKVDRQEVEALNQRGREGWELDGILRWFKGSRFQYSYGGIGINSLTWPLSPLRDYIMFPYKKAPRSSSSIAF